MKTGLGLFRTVRWLKFSLNIFGFWIRKTMLGFDVANQFIQRVDKISLQHILSSNGAKIGLDCDIETGLTFHNCRDYSNLIIGNNCHVGKNCFFDLRGKVIIEDNVVVSMLVTFITHQDLNKSNLRNLYPATFADIRIGKNAYVGAAVTILKGVTVGAFSVIAAGALVTRNVKTKSIAAGVPARHIKMIELPE